MAVGHATVSSPAAAHDGPLSTVHILYTEDTLSLELDQPPTRAPPQAGEGRDANI